MKTLSKIFEKAALVLFVVWFVSLVVMVPCQVAIVTPEQETLHEVGVIASYVMGLSCSLGFLCSFVSLDFESRTR